MRRWIDLFVDVQDAPVQADEERPTGGKRLVLIDDPVRRGDGLGRITQKRVVNAERLCELFVRLLGIDTYREMRDVEAPDFFATLTE